MVSQVVFCSLLLLLFFLFFFLFIYIFVRYFAELDILSVYVGMSILYNLLDGTGLMGVARSKNVG